MTTRLALRMAVLGLAFGIAACGSSPPSTEPPPVGRPPSACIGLAAAQCDQVLVALDGHLAGATPTYVAIAERLCDGPCPGAEHGAWLGHLTVEFGAGQKPQTILVAVDGQAIDWEPIETALIALTPDLPA